MKILSVHNSYQNPGGEDQVFAQEAELLRAHGHQVLLYHASNMESFTYPRARQVVVPSRGLAKELITAFPYIDNKLTVLPNPISLDRLQMPSSFDRLPIVVSQLYGVEDLLVDGDNGFLIETSVAGVRNGLQRFLELSGPDRHTMGQRARLEASGCSEQHFVDAWRAFYLRLAPLSN